MDKVDFRYITKRNGVADQSIKASHDELDTTLILNTVIRQTPPTEEQRAAYRRFWELLFRRVLGEES